MLCNYKDALIPFFITNKGGNSEGGLGGFGFGLFWVGLI